MDGNQRKSGAFIAIEGSDGSGKGTQFDKLVERLRESNYDVATYDFPQYEKPSSYFVKEYLNGKYGDADQLGSYIPSYFYALDRFSAARDIRHDLENGKLVIANRFAGSNMGHQGGKLSTFDERRAFFKWASHLEFEELQIPEPNINLVLLVEPEVAQSLVDQKEERSYTKEKRDIHEADLNHLRNAVDTYRQLCDVFPEQFVPIDCVDNGELMSIDKVHQLIWSKIQPIIE